MTDHEQRVQHEVDRLLAAMVRLAEAEFGDPAAEETLAGFVLGFRAANATNVENNHQLVASIFDALAELANVVREYAREEFTHG